MCTRDGYRNYVKIIMRNDFKEEKKVDVFDKKLLKE